MFLAQKSGRREAASYYHTLLVGVRWTYANSKQTSNVFFSPTDCEHLIRRMLVLDPSKRLTIAQIKEHKWMLIEVPAQRSILYAPGQENQPSIGEYNEQVLRLMHSLGIDQQKTIAVKQTWAVVPGREGEVIEVLSSYMFPCNPNLCFLLNINANRLLVELILSFPSTVVDAFNCCGGCTWVLPTRGGFSAW